jgi:ribonuclease BN (tRNA processing enzyme)
VAFEVTVLGSSATFPVPDSACSGYLLRSDGVSIWVDAGPGTFPNLQRHVDFRSVRALLLSHLHTDHFLDLYPFYYGTRYGLDAGEPKGFPVYGPAGTELHLGGPISSVDAPADFGGYLTFHVLSAGGELSLEGFDLWFARSVHPIETLAMRITAGGRTLGYTADTGQSTELPGFFKGADSLICEATLQEEVPELAEIHLTAEQAGALAAEAGVSQLILTHILPGLDHHVSVDQARKKFDGEVLLAADNFEFQV